MKTLTTLVFVTTAAFAGTPSAHATELSVPSINTQAISAFATELMSQQMAELKVAIVEQSKKALAELEFKVVQTTATEQDTVVEVAKVD